MAGSNEDRSRSRRLGAEVRVWSSIGRVLSGQRIERSDDVVCDLYHTQRNEERGFLGLASKPRSTLSPGLASKSVATVSLSFASKPVATVLMVWHQNHSLGFPDLGIKTDSCGLVIWPTKLPRRYLCLVLKTKRAIVCQLRHKTDERMKMVWGMR
jgi:hypothetical protein